jgi:amino acid transporter
MSDSDGRLGLVGAASIGLGGMIGGGVFAVLGVVATLAGPAAWLAFTGACVVSACAAYSYIRLNRVTDRRGGSVTMLAALVSDGTLAGVVGWTLLVGYVGAVAMYAFAFGGFAVELLGVASVAGLPARPLLSAAVVLGFVGLNTLGARATGTSETVLVVAKLLVLLVFGGWGLYYGGRTGQLAFGFDRLDTVGPVFALAVSFVSFQGWQLLMYDQDAIRDPDWTVPRAVYLSIAVTVLVDGLIAIVVTSLVPAETIARNPETALAIAAEPFVGQIGFTAVSVAALFSTGSAINGTLFSAAHFGKRLLSEDLLPDRLGDADADGAPVRTLVALGVLAAAFSAVGSLQGITSFGSLAFMAVFGAMSYLAFRHRGGVRTALAPAVGTLGTGLLFPVLCYHLATNEPRTFGVVVVLAVAVVGVELLYFERERLVERVVAVEELL